MTYANAKGFTDELRSETLNCEFTMGNNIVSVAPQ